MMGREAFVSVVPQHLKLPLLALGARQRSFTADVRVVLPDHIHALWLEFAVARKRVGIAA